MGQVLIKLSLSFVLIFSSLTSFVYGQQKNVSHSQQLWAHYFQHLRLADDWTLITDAAYRWKLDPFHSSQYVARTAIAYQLKQPIQLSVGFANVGYYQNGSIHKIEFRPHQELTLKQKLGKITTKHRFRTEQRIFRGMEEGHVNNDAHFNWRLRYLFAMQIPLYSFSTQEPNRKLSLNLADEINLNAGKEIVYNHFSRNRLMITPVFQWNAKLSLKFSFTQQFTAANAPATYDSARIYWLGIVHKIDGSKKNQG